MGRFFGLPVAAVLGVPVVGLLLVAQPADAASTGPTVTGPQGDTALARLLGVDSLSPSDAWAVGDVQLGNQTSTLIEHWDGTSWAQVPSPSPGGMFGSTLSGVTALAADDVWAVGSYRARATGQRTLVLHWDGQCWTQVPSPDPSSSFDNVLTSVHGLAADDVWAVGWHTSVEIDAVTLTMHWDGSSWSEVLSPNPSHRIANTLSGVSGVSDRDVWTVGSFSRSTTETSTLVARWNGKRWSRPISPNPGRLTNELSGVSAATTKDVWAVGSYSDLPGETRNLIEHWNGRRWLRTAGPDLGGVPNVLTAVSAESSQDAWAVGYMESAGGANQTLTLHWDGTTWAVVPSPNPGVFASRLYAVAVADPTSAWAVGGAFAAANSGAELITAWNGEEWQLY